MENEKLELIIDSEDTYQGLDNVFYLHPSRLSFLTLVSDNQFDSCTVKNSPVDSLTSLHLSYVLRKLKVNAPMEVIIFQQITVMQEYNAKQVEANAQLAGFSDLEIKDSVFINKSGKKFNTLSVTGVKAAKSGTEIEVEVVTTEKKSGVVKKAAPSGNATVTTFSAASSGKGKGTAVSAVRKKKGANII